MQKKTNWRLAKIFCPEKGHPSNTLLFRQCLDFFTKCLYTQKTFCPLMVKDQAKDHKIENMSTMLRHPPLWMFVDNYNNN